jgi:hypothetical protein
VDGLFHLFFFGWSRDWENQTLADEARSGPWLRWPVIFQKAGVPPGPTHPDTMYIHISSCVHKYLLWQAGLTG